MLLSANAAWNLLNFRSGLLRGLRAARHELVAAVPSDPESEARLAALGCRCVSVPVDSQGLSPRRDLQTLAAYRALLARERPDCFLAFTAKPNIYGSLAARSLGIPAVNNISGLGAAFIAGGWLAWTLKRLYRAALAKSPVVFFQNASDRDEMLGAGVVRAERTRLIPGSGVDLAHFRPEHRSAGDGDATFKFLMIGRVVRDKGVVEYAEAAATLRARLPGLTFGLLGAIEPQHPTAIDPATVAGWEEAGTLVHHGTVPDPRPLIAQADCVVLPSYREGTSRALLEAAAMGKPLVATDVPGCREVVDDGVSGFLCRVRDAGSLADAMARMAALDPAARARMGAASRAKMEREFDEKIVIRAYLEALDEIAAARGRH